jgi:hypothetical protein
VVRGSIFHFDRSFSCTTKPYKAHIRKHTALSDTICFKKTLFENIFEEITPPWEIVLDTFGLNYARINF